MVNVTFAFAASVVGSVVVVGGVVGKVVSVAATLLIETLESVNVDVPVFFTSITIVPVVAGSTVAAVKTGVPKDTCSVCMNPTDIPPIHAATAMLTATVTAISMIDATTGLRAFAFFLNFLKFILFFKLLWVWLN